MTDTKIVLPPDFQGRELIIGAPQDFEQVRKARKYEDKRHRTITSIADLATYLKRFGDPIRTAIFCSQDRIKAILDEEIPIAEVSYAVKFSTAFTEWKNAFQRAFTQAEFKEFVERRQSDIIDGINLLNVVSDLKLSTTIVHDGAYDNDHNYQVIFKESTGGESAVKIPKCFQVNIPLTDGDTFRYDLNVELKLSKPKSADEKFLFKLKCWDLEDILNAAMEDRITDLKKDLDGWHIYAGLPQ
jgi:hypothetical protein